MKKVKIINSIIRRKEFTENKNLIILIENLITTY